MSVPLLFEQRATLVEAVSASMAAVVKNILPCMAWALLLTLTVVGAIVLLPLLPVAFQIAAYAIFSPYRMMFPGDGS